IEGKLHIVMELAECSLRERLKQCRASGQVGIPPRELVTYFREAADALDYMHEQEILHRDIKPENILIIQRHAKVADFGLARGMQNQSMASVSGSGTPRYMAPEVWRGRFSRSSDQYSLALAYADLGAGSGKPKSGQLRSARTPGPGSIRTVGNPADEGLKTVLSSHEVELPPAGTGQRSSVKPGGSGQRPTVKPGGSGQRPTIKAGGSGQRPSVKTGVVEAPPTLMKPLSSVVDSERRQAIDTQVH